VPLRRPCRNRWCPNLDCAVHAPQPFATGTPMLPGWAATRDLQLALFPLCWSCREPATEVHHLVPRYAGGTDALHNLRSLCGPCHRRLPSYARFT
jgi:5-methylcytosine-specific restriction endonuclease McrA